MASGREDRRRHRAAWPRGDAEPGGGAARLTSGSAWVAHDDDVRGSLEVGKWADLAVLSSDYMTVPVEQIGGIESLLTMVGGRVVYAAGSFRGLENMR